MALTLSGTNGVVGAGFTVDASGVSVTAGVGTFGSLAAPAAGLTGALPALSAASLTSIPAANLVGVATAGFGNASGAYSQGITEVDTWRLTTAYGNNDGSTLDVDPLQSNLVRIDQPINGYKGTGMTLSSGIWTFPSTGYWLVIAQMCMNGVANAESRYNDVRIKGTTNNSSYVDLSRGYAMFEDYSTSRFMTFTVSTVCDITDVSTHKVKFTTTTLNNTRVVGDSEEEQTSFKFIRLGDT